MQEGDALRDFKGSDFREFWNDQLPAQREFQDKPELVSGLLLTQQLTLLTGNHQTLVNELQVHRQLTSPQQLVELEKSDWVDIIKKTGVQYQLPDGSKTYGKSINGDPEKYFTPEIMKLLEDAAKKEFLYG